MQPLYWVDAFTSRAFAGNPAVVCLLDSSAAEDWMQSFAAEMNVSETAFLTPGKPRGLRWFTPGTEVDHVDGCDLAPDEVAALTKLQTARIELADQLLVIDVGGYVGSATADEIALASSLGKRIRYWSREHPGVPERRLRPMDVLLEVATVHAEQGFVIAAHPTTDVAPELKELSCALIEEEASEFREAVETDDLVAIADAVADLLWVVNVGALTFGIPLGEVFAEVLRSNRSKMDDDGTVLRAPSGKIVKGPNFSPPELDLILARHAPRYPMGRRIDDTA